MLSGLRNDPERFWEMSAIRAETNESRLYILKDEMGCDRGFRKVSHSHLGGGLAAFVGARRKIDEKTKKSSPTHTIV